MKQYTHARLAFIAIERLEKAALSVYYKRSAEQQIGLTTTAMGWESEFYLKGYAIEKGKLPSRCWALAHRIIDNLKKRRSGASRITAYLL